MTAERKKGARASLTGKERAEKYVRLLIVVLLNSPMPTVMLSNCEVMVMPGKC